MQTETAREQMIHQQLRAWHVLDQAVLETFARVPRERFVPPAYAEVAFADTEIPLGGDDHMLAPKVAGRILQAVAPQSTDRVLEIGTGSGYLSACLAAHACSVRSLEIRDDLAQRTATPMPPRRSATAPTRSSCSPVRSRRATRASRGASPRAAACSSCSAPAR